MGTSSLIRSLQTRENSLPTLTGFDTSTTSLLWVPGFKLPTWNLLLANFISLPPSPPLTVSTSLATPWTIACQAPLSMGFSRQHWSGLSFPSPRELPTRGSNLCLLHWQAGSLPLNHKESPTLNYQLNYLKNYLMWILVLKIKFASPTFNYRYTSTFILSNSITISSMFGLYCYTDFFKNMYLKTE